MLKRIKETFKNIAKPKKRLLYKELDKVIPKQTNGQNNKNFHSGGECTDKEAPIYRDEHSKDIRKDE